jgi:hypothetical protein
VHKLTLEMGKNLKSMVLVRFGFLYGQGSVRFWFLLSCCLKSSGSVRVLPINGSVRVRFLVLFTIIYCSDVCLCLHSTCSIAYNMYIKFR